MEIDIQIVITVNYIIQLLIFQIFVILVLHVLFLMDIITMEKYLEMEKTTL